MSDNGCAGYIGNACESGLRWVQKIPSGRRTGYLLFCILRAGQHFTDPVISLDLFSTFTAAAGEMVEQTTA